MTAVGLVAEELRAAHRRYVLAREIQRVTDAVERYQVRMDAICERIADEGGPQSSHEHDACWKALSDKKERAAAWLCILLRKRNGAEDERFAKAIEMGAWP